MTLTSFPNGVASFGVPVMGSGQLPVSGVYFFVDFTNGADGNVGTYDSPMKTIDAAVGRCVANRGDVIVCLPGHAETITGASGITMDVAGVTVQSLGLGADRAELTFGTATSASIVISAPNCAFVNIVGIGGIDGLTNPFHVQAAGCTLDITWRDTSSLIEAARAILTTAAANNLTIKLTYQGFPAGNACVNAIRLVGNANVSIETNFYGIASTAWVEFLTVACTNVTVQGYMYNSGTTNGTKNVVDTATSSTWYVNIADGAAGAIYAGGSAAAPVVVDVAAITNALYGAAGIASFPAGAAAANAVSIAEVLRYVQDQVINGTGTVLDTNTSLYGVLAGASGVPTYPTAAAAANAVSMAEVLRFNQDMSAMAVSDFNSTNYFAVLADMTSSTWNTAAAHEIVTVTGAVHLIILPECTGTITSAGGNATLILGDETTTNSLITSSDSEALAVGEWWFDATMTRTVGLRAQINALDFVIANGKDVGYTIGTEALTGGSITFHCWWRPVKSGGVAAAGAGGAL